jgi:hypothetical protein
MYKAAYRFDDETVFYFDIAGNKYVASGGSLSWRINNPGLVHSHGFFSHTKRAIGNCGHYAIFRSVEDGREALRAWIHSKKYFNHSLKRLAGHYQLHDSNEFVNRLVSLSGLTPNTKIKSLSLQELDRLLMSLEKLCGYATTGNERFSLLPKIIARIELGKNLEDSYLIGENCALSQKEAIEWVRTHRLDAVIVNGQDGVIHLRSRPHHSLQYLKVASPKILSSIGNIDTLVRVVGEEKPGQCIWGFINGINNKKEEALESANQISQAAGGERVFSMPNDTALLGAKDILVCIALKATIDPPVVQWAAKFFKYLLSLSENHKDHPPVIIFAHSQGAIIAEHALALLDRKDREKLIVFTFGGGSFISPGVCHSDSHNYSSAADFVCRLGSPNLQFLALQRYFGYKEGRTEGEVIHQLARNDALLHLDSIDPETIRTYTEQKVKYYEGEFFKINNVTVLDPDPLWRHRFCSSCYQNAVQAIVKKYQSS